MQPLTADDLMSLEQYARERPRFRQHAVAHKRARALAVGPNMRLLFEDQLTIQYQVQEMLRIERIFEPDGIAEELGAYNPLIPDGDNWKATCMIEFPDVEERRRKLAELVGIEDRIWVRVGDGDPVYAIADEDMERATEAKTSAVHFLRFQLPGDDIATLKAGATLAVGVDHEHYRHAVDPVPQALHEQLLADLD